MYIATLVPPESSRRNVLSCIRLPTYLPARDQSFFCHCCCYFPYANISYIVIVQPAMTAAIRTMKPSQKPIRLRHGDKAACRPGLACLSPALNTHQGSSHLAVVVVAYYCVGRFEFETLGSKMTMCMKIRWKLDCLHRLFAFSSSHSFPLRENISTDLVLEMSRKARAGHQTCRCGRAFTLMNVISSRLSRVLPYHPGG